MAVCVSFLECSPTYYLHFLGAWAGYFLVAVPLFFWCCVEGCWKGSKKQRGEGDLELGIKGSAEEGQRYVDKSDVKWRLFADSWE